MKIFKKKRKEIMYFALIESSNHKQSFTEVFEGKLSKYYFQEWLIECISEFEKETKENAVISNCKVI